MTFHFGDFHLDPAARELRQGDQLVDLARRTFDGLVFLIEHRDRAVSRDELIDELWGKPVEDIQVTQLVMRLRRLLGDDSSEPTFIRAVPGFGYRWIAETRVLPAESEPGEADAQSVPVVAAEPKPEPALPHPRRRRLWATIVVLAIAAGLIAALFHLVSVLRPGEQPVEAPGEAVVILPLEIQAAAAAEVGWARLGAMDLIGSRLREAGLPVPPSESVISVVQAQGNLPEAELLAVLRDALGAETLVQGSIEQADHGWIIALDARQPDGHAHTVQSEPGEIISAAHHAANLLLAALGHAVPETGTTDVTLGEWVQRVRAAGLALEIDAARAIIGEAPEHLQREPELRNELAWIEMRAGRPDAVMAITSELLNDPAVQQQARLHARVLITHGVAQVMEHGSWQAGEQFFDTVVEVLENELWAPELGRALMMRSAARGIQQRYDDAARDLGRARALFESGGDRRGMAQVENYFGNLELQRGRPGDALAHFRNAIEIDSGLSHIDGLRANLSAKQRAEMQLLRWSDALDTSEQLWALHEHFQKPVDPHRLHSLGMHRAEVLIALGRHREARAILTDFAGADQAIPDYGLRYEMELRARLAWQEADWDGALQASWQALEIWLSDELSASDQPAGLALLHQRTSLKSGVPMAAAELLPRVPESGQLAAYLVASAEWAVHQGDDDQSVEQYFHQATLQAESRAEPAVHVLVADAYARWLLTRDRFSEALAVAGRIARWAEEDYLSALLQLEVLHASDRREAWQVARSRAQQLAGEREVPVHLLAMP